MKEKDIVNSHMININPFEGINNNLFSSKDSMKLANIDAFFRIISKDAFERYDIEDSDPINRFLPIKEQKNELIKDYKDEEYGNKFLGYKEKEITDNIELEEVKNMRYDGDYFIDENLTFLDIYGGSGAFVEYMIWRVTNSKGWGFTPKGSNDYKIKSDRFTPFYGDGKDGELLNIINTKSLVTKILKDTNDKGVDIVFANGEIEDELSFQKLFLAEISVAISILKKGGNFVCKIQDIFFLMTINLLYLLSNEFESISIFKPISVEPSSSEKYVICKNFRGNRDNFIILLNFITLYVNSEKMKLSFPKSIFIKMSKEFIKYIDEVNSTLVNKQIFFLLRIKDSIEGNLLPLDKIYKIDIVNKLWYLPLSKKKLKPIESYLEKGIPHLQFRSPLLENKGIFRILNPDKTPKLKTGSPEIEYLTLDERGQLLSDIEFLTKYGPDKGTILYIGASPGRYLKLLLELFPMYDIEAYGSSLFEVKSTEKGVSPELILNNEPFTSKKAIEFASASDIIIISRINNIESNEMWLNKWVKSKNKIIAKILFEPIKTIEFYKGEIYFPIWSKSDNKKTHLIITDVNKKMTYNYNTYNDMMRYFNVHMRMGGYMQNYVGEGLDRCYDCKSETEILKNLAYKRNESNKRDFVVNLSLRISRLLNITLKVEGKEIEEHQLFKIDPKYRNKFLFGDLKNESPYDALELMINKVIELLGDIKTLIITNGHLGGDAILFSNISKIDKIEVYEKDNYKFLNENIKLSLNSKKIEIYNKDFYKEINELKEGNIVYLNPDYSSIEGKLYNETRELLINNIDIMSISDSIMKRGTKVILRLPYNFDTRTVESRFLFKELRVTGKIQFLLLLDYKNRNYGK